GKHELSRIRVLVTTCGSGRLVGRSEAGRERPVLVNSVSQIANVSRVAETPFGGGYKPRRERTAVKPVAPEIVAHAAAALSAASRASRIGQWVSWPRPYHDRDRQVHASASSPMARR